MAAFIYQCPVTGYRVQAFVADEVIADETAWENVACPVCSRQHLVNPATGKVMGRGSED